MGLRKSPTDTWLSIDEQYLAEHKIKASLLEHKKDRLLNSSDCSQAACEEALEVIVEYLTETYPKSFKQYDHRTSGPCVEVIETGEIFGTKAPFVDMSPLEIAARLAMEDFNILIKDDNDEHILRASATCYPVGWSVDRRINWPIYKVHGPVPMWQEKLRRPVERFFSSVKTHSVMERSAYFVQVADLQTDLAQILCKPESLDYGTKPTRPQHVIIRRERQTFKRLPKTNAILFAVKTALRPLTELSVSELRSFKQEASNWPEEVARYKGRQCWEECAFDYCDAVLSKVPSEIS
ncbi:hypothetical protein MMC30_006328 [Trapelia coarctata]|nr:hypothetical protein [Trapelia coarctata]